MTTSTRSGRSTSLTSPRAIDLRLASLHLRTGAYGLARAELETLAGRAELDDEGLLDLAEIRWRTGDVPGAGEAASAYLGTSAGQGSVLGLVIAAEATAALGRPGEARRLAGQALERAGAPLDGVFAGISRSAIWPIDPADPGTPAGTLFHPVAPAEPPARADAGLWDDHPHVDQPGADLPDPNEELNSAREALAAGDAATAAVRLAVVLRVRPALAPAVLDVAGTETGAAFDLVRGDAYRLVGHELEARREYGAAAASLAGDPDETSAADTVSDDGTADDGVAAHAAAADAETDTVGPDPGTTQEDS
jgi:hypothetical protein